MPYLAYVALYSTYVILRTREVRVSVCEREREGKGERERMRQRVQGAGFRGQGFTFRTARGTESGNVREREGAREYLACVALYSTYVILRTREVTSSPWRQPRGKSQVNLPQMLSPGGGI